MREVVNRIAAKVEPSKEAREAKDRVARLAMSQVKEKARGIEEIVGVEFGGSYAKDTWGDQDADIDIFVRFRETVEKDILEEISNRIGFGALEEYGPYSRYAEHPYVEARVEGTRVNIVPFYDVEKGEWKSAADRSAFHTKLMKEALTAEMRRDVRVLKAFLKGNGIYGSEIASQGFSGYVAEVLVMLYGSFEGVVRGMAGAAKGQIIGKAARDFDGPLAIIDPVDGNRNLGIAISDKNLGTMIVACRAFLENPSEDFFRHRAKRASGYAQNILAVEVRFQDRSPDVIWGQIKKAASSLAKRLTAGGFTVFRSSAHVEDGHAAYMFFLLESHCIPGIYTKRGPSFFMKEYADDFIRKNANGAEVMWIGEDHSIISLKVRKCTRADAYMRDSLNDGTGSGVPHGLQNDFAAGFRVHTGTQGLPEGPRKAAEELISTDGAFLDSDA